MFNNKKVAQLEKTVAGLQDDLTHRKQLTKAIIDDNERLQDKVNEVELRAFRDKEISEYKLGLVEQLMKQLTININMNSKGKK